MMEDEKRAGAHPANQAAPVSGSTTEDLLNDILAECRDIARKVAKKVPEEEVNPLAGMSGSMSVLRDVVRIGTDLGVTVAKLRGGATEERLQRIVVERVARSVAGEAAGRGEGGRAIPENE